MRALAVTLGCSPATVSLAFRILRERGLIVTDGRRGTRVAPRPPLLGSEAAGPRAPLPAGMRDLSLGLPDPALLPSVADALARADLTGALRVAEIDRDDPALLARFGAALRADGIAADHLVVTSGAFDAIERVLGAHLRPGDRVLVEDPSYAAFRDLLTALGLLAVPVAIDDEGPLPDAFAAALERGVAAALLIPRAQNPTGAARGAQRACDLSAVLAQHPGVLMIEDDHAGAVAGAPMHPITAGERWAVVRSTSKMLHPDLRVAVVAGDAVTVGRVAGRQALGPRWVSAVLQATVLALLSDPVAEAAVINARDTYARRRQALLGALAEHGIAAHGRSGLNVWVPVREETATVAALAAAGYAAAAGERFRLRCAPGVRITVAALPEPEARAVARAIAAAERPARTSY